MKLPAIVLDTYPLGLVTARPGRQSADACRQWLNDCMQAGANIYVPEIADYELRRELKRAGKSASIARLDTLKTKLHYVPITTQAMLLAADLWAQARNRGIPTADAQGLDGDVILAAQTLLLGFAPTEIIVATSNVRHLSRFVAADLWENIGP